MFPARLRPSLGPPLGTSPRLRPGEDGGDVDDPERISTDRLIAAVFGLKYEGKKAYWIYYIKRGSFYPLVLSGDQERDNAAESRLGAVMEEHKIPVERDLERWYALWGIPF